MIGFELSTQSGFCVLRVIEFAERDYTVVIPVFSLRAWTCAKRLMRDVTAEQMTAYRRAGYDIRPGLPRTKFEAGWED